MKNDQSNWSKFTLGKEEREKRTLYIVIKAKVQDRDFVLPAKMQWSMWLDQG
jgi:hypothetical protein